MHAKSDNVELVSYKVNDIVDKLFESLCSRYQFRNINGEKTFCFQVSSIIVL